MTRFDKKKTKAKFEKSFMHFLGASARLLFILLCDTILMQSLKGK